MEELARQFCREARERSGLRYSGEQRQVALAYAREAARCGRSRREIAAALCLNEAPLSRWPGGGGETGPLHEVVVVETAATGGGVLVMPSGVRVEGLSLRELVSVLEA